MTQNISPIEQVISLALEKQQVTGAQLAALVNMAPTNFSLARNLKRSFPLAALLTIFELAGLTNEKQIEVLKWVASKPSNDAK